MQESNDILVIGNDAVSMSGLKALLTKNGYKCTLATGPESAGKHCRNESFSLAIFDGADVLKAGKIAVTNPVMNCILLTDTPLQTKTRDDNIIAVLPRPVDPAMLLCIICHEMDRKNGETYTCGSTEKTELSLVDSQELNKMKSSLLSTVSHELRTPLASIKGYASMILDYEDRMKPADRRESLNAIVKASDRLVVLIDQLIDLSRFEAGLIKLSPVSSSLRHIIGSVADDVREKNPDYRFKKTVKGIPSQMDLDTRRIRQVLDNLVDNAVKYSPPGTLITVGARTENNNVLVWVQDEGYGIPEDEKDRIFTSLYRLKATGKDDTGGLGLGLSLCKNLVEAHSGRIWVEDNPGKGCTFFFTLPIR